MKKYISLALIWSFCLLAFSACESYLEEMPQNKLMPTTTDDYDQFVNNAYITERVMPYLDILSDDVELIASNHVLDGEDEGVGKLPPICGATVMTLPCRGEIWLSRNFMRVFIIAMW